MFLTNQSIEEISKSDFLYLFVSSSNYIGGAELSLSTLLQSEPALERRSTLISSSDELIEKHQAKISALYLERAKSLTGQFRWLREIQKLSGRNQTVLVCFSLEIAPAIAILKVLNWRKIKMVLDLHDSLPSRSGILKVRLLGLLCDRVIAVSSFAARQAPSSKTIVLYRPIYASSIKAIGTVGGRSIGIVGRIDPDKNIELAIEVAKLLPNFNFYFFGAPSPGFESYFQGLRSQTGSAKNVYWQGRETTDEIYSKIDVLLVTNHNEALGRTILEAKLCGLHVVGPVLGGFMEIQQKSSSGRTYKENDPIDAMQAILAVFKDSPAALQKDKVYWTKVTDASRYSAKYFAILAGEEV